MSQDGMLYGGSRGSYMDRPTDGERLIGEAHKAAEPRRVPRLWAFIGGLVAVAVPLAAIIGILH